MNLTPRLIYRALAWKERKRVELSRRRDPTPGKQDQRQDNRQDQRQDNRKTGARGETLAYWYLRQAGYTIVARNLRAQGNQGEVDLIGWDGNVLAFIEVKTRTTLAAGEPEAAVTGKKRQRVVRAARQYMRGQGLISQPYRFDLISIYWDLKEGLRVRLTKDAFKGAAF